MVNIPCHCLRPLQVPLLLFALAAFCAVPSAGNAASAGIQVTLDRNPVATGASFVATFEAASVDDDPDFSPLRQDFDVLGTSKRSNITLVNGRFSKSSTWLVNLIPKRAGALMIPPIHFGRDVSPETPITVTAATGPQAGDAGADLFMEIDAGPKNPYVQAQTLYTIRIFNEARLEINDATLSDPKVSAGDAVITQTGKDRNFEKMRDGKRYSVFERSYAVFPQNHGKVTIDPVVFEGQIVEGSGSLADPFGHAIRTRRLQSEPVTLDVRPIPAAFTGRHWLPARALQLHETWSDDTGKIAAGDPVTRTLSVLANGLTAGQLPELQFDVPAGLKSYPDQPVLDDQKKSDGVTGLRQEKLVLIPAQGGDYTLPEIRIPWWNTDTDRLEVATLPALALHVPAPARPANTEPSPAATAVQPHPPVFAPPPANTPALAAAESRPATSAWRGLSLALAGGWGVTVLAWRHSSRIRLRTLMTARRQRARKIETLAKRVVDACHRDDAAATRDALLAWAQAQWPSSTVCNVVEIGARQEPLRTLLEELNRCLYGAGHPPWRGEALAQAFRTVRAPSAPVCAGLEPLYRTSA